MIEIDKLHIGYHSTILEVNRLDLKNGQLYILIGRNGSGKSTFLKSLGGEIPYLSGSARIEKKEISTISQSEIPFLLSTVRSSFNHIDYMSVYNYVAMGRSPYTNAFGKLREEDKSAIEKAITSVGIIHLKDRFTSELSDGERQLASIAKAIAQGTNVILLDEPTAYLDYLNRMNILNVLKNIAQDQNKCIVMSSHDIDIAIESNCEFLVVTKNQKIELFKELSKEGILELAFTS